jgi:hypothetical protein
VADQRLKGQETELRLIVDNEVQDTITDIRSFEMHIQLAILTEGYLGETTMRRDEVFNGVTGQITLHFENEDIFTLFQTIVDRARRRQPGGKINAKTSVRFPNGQNKVIMISNVFFGEIPMNFPGRAEYATVSLSFEAEDYQII